MIKAFSWSIAFGELKRDCRAFKVLRSSECPIALTFELNMVERISNISFRINFTEYGRRHSINSAKHFD